MAALGAAGPGALPGASLPRAALPWQASCRPAGRSPRGARGCVEQTCRSRTTCRKETERISPAVAWSTPYLRRTGTAVPPYHGADGKAPIASNAGRGDGGGSTMGWRGSAAGQGGGSSEARRGQCSWVRRATNAAEHPPMQVAMEVQGSQVPTRIHGSFDCRRGSMGEGRQQNATSHLLSRHETNSGW